MTTNKADRKFLKACGIAIVDTEPAAPAAVAEAIVAKSVLPLLTPAEIELLRQQYYEREEKMLRKMQRWAEGRL